MKCCEKSRGHAQNCYQLGSQSYIDSTSSPQDPSKWLQQMSVKYLDAFTQNNDRGSITDFIQDREHLIYRFERNQGMRAKMWDTEINIIKDIVELHVVVTGRVLLRSDNVLKLLETAFDWVKSYIGSARGMILDVNCHNVVPNIFFGPFHIFMKIPTGCNQHMFSVPNSWEI